MVDINITSPADTDVVSQYPADERASRTAILDIINGKQFWGGTSAGSANNQTLTVDVTGLALVAGLRVTFIGGFDRSGTVNFDVNGLGNVAAVDRSGAALSASFRSTKAGDLHEIVYDGTNFRILTGDAFVQQAVYDALLPVGFVQLRWDGTAPVVPPGVTATWTAINDTDRYLRINNAGGGGTGGSASEPHTHGDGSYAVSGTTGTSDTNNDGADGSGRPSPTHRHTFSAQVTGTSASTAVDITPKFRDVRAYRRSA